MRHAITPSPASATSHPLRHHFFQKISGLWLGTVGSRYGTIDLHHTTFICQSRGAVFRVSLVSQGRHRTPASSQDQAGPSGGVPSRLPGCYLSKHEGACDAGQCTAPSASIFGTVVRSAKHGTSHWQQNSTDRPSRITPLAPRCESHRHQACAAPCPSPQWRSPPHSCPRQTAPRHQHAPQDRPVWQCTRPASP